jgi:hypothetical protein
MRVSTKFERLFKTDEEIKKEVIRDFASDFMKEVQKLVDKYGKAELLEKLRA